MSGEEDEKMLAYLKALGVPQVKDLEELKTFMTEYGTPTVKKSDPVTSEDKTKIKTQTHIPRISIFFGEEGKGEVSYQTWAYEVKCLQAEKIYSDEVLLQAIRRSLRAHAADQLRYIGVKPSINTILDNFNSTYGMVDTPESILKKFYACKQNPDESVLNYCIRIEEIYAQALEMGALAEAGGMLKRVFYRGLTPQLKHLSAFKFETITDYKKFKKEVRQIENELNDDTNMEASKPETKTKCHAVNKKEDNESSKLGKQLNELTTMMEKLNTRMEQMEQAQEQNIHLQQQAQTSQTDSTQPIYQQQYQHPQQQSYTRMPYQEQRQVQPEANFNQQTRYNQPQQSYTYRPVGFRGPRHFRGPRSFMPKGQGPFRGQGRGSNSYRIRTPIAGNTFMPECWACHRRGHLARDCSLNC